MRIMSNGSFGLSKPCEECVKVLKEYKIYRVYYTLPGSELTWVCEKVSEMESSPSSGTRKMMRNK